jgi:hypothetical protein
MAKLYVAEYARSSSAGPGDTGAPMAIEPPLAEQVVTFTTTTACDNAFNAATRFVRIHTDSICHIAFGTAPSATTSLKRMAANTTEYFAVPPGASYKVAAVTGT